MRLPRLRRLQGQRHGPRLQAGVGDAQRDVPRGVPRGRAGLRGARVPRGREGLLPARGPAPGVGGGRRARQPPQPREGLRGRGRREGGRPLAHGAGEAGGVRAHHPREDGCRRGALHDGGQLHVLRAPRAHAGEGDLRHNPLHHRRDRRLVRQAVAHDPAQAGLHRPGHGGEQPGHRPGARQRDQRGGGGAVRGRVRLRLEHHIQLPRRAPQDSPRARGHGHLHLGGRRADAGARAARRRHVQPRERAGGARRHAGRGRAADGRRGKEVAGREEGPGEGREGGRGAGRGARAPGRGDRERLQPGEAGRGAGGLRQRGGPREGTGQRVHGALAGGGERGLGPGGEHVREGRRPLAGAQGRAAEAGGAGRDRGHAGARHRAPGPDRAGREVEAAPGRGPSQGARAGAEHRAKGPAPLPDDHQGRVDGRHRPRRHRRAYAG
mmetsp:Transcript_23719/g.66613  ORF Transcript_23719/g.66613 Transcript_23719/m.66613 type:complete len:438 (+) Transcript_23719:52-1365(+)